MKKNEQEYMPQFEEAFANDAEDYEREKVIIESNCRVCGKIAVLRYGGVCRDCISLKRLNGHESYIVYSGWVDKNIRISGMVAAGIYGLILWPFLQYGFWPIFFFARAIDAFAFAMILMAALGKIVIPILLLLLSIVMVIIGVKMVGVAMERRKKDFAILQKKKVNISDYGNWKCPNCKYANEGLVRCRFCGVLPNFYLKSKK